MYNFIKLITEGKVGKELTHLKLNYDLDELDPSLSKDSLEYHYGTLYKGYVDRFNKGEGDLDFNEAGAFLHNIYFSQFQPLESRNEPKDRILEFINDHYKNFENFKNEFEKVAMKIQGSGWVYLSKSGDIKTIVNHQIKNDIVLIVDWWEHAFNIDYRADKAKYLKNQWRIIDWSLIQQRI